MATSKPHRKYLRSREASLWQSAADQVLSKSRKQRAEQGVVAGAPAAAGPVDPALPEMNAANTAALAVEQSLKIPQHGVEAEPMVEGAAPSVPEFCARAAFQLARARVKKILTGDDTDEKKFQDELGAQFGTCDPRWSECISEYIKNRVSNDPIPYRRYKQLSDFVIDDVLGDSARIALVGDWATGDATASAILQKIAQKQPDVVIHLGDTYYSGTDHEAQNYFYAIWQGTFDLPAVAWGGKPAARSKPATFTLAGNHDMYAGGKAYYTVIDMLGQPASYFCLRNKSWQLIAMDTGLHDNDPTARSMTFLEDQEVAWIRDKIQNAGGRKTVLLSHHQLFTTFESIGPPGNRINQTLQKQLQAVLPAVTVWYWGHEHDFVIYPSFMNILARCIGHGAVPVGFDQGGTADPAVPFENIRLAVDGDGGLFQHGYAIMDLNGAAATVTHYQFDPVSGKETTLYSETFQA
jgi:hypothetical protein